MNIDWDIVSGAAAAFATIISLIALYAAYRSQRRMEKLAAQSWSDTYFRDITLWASDVVGAISRAIHLIDVDDEEARRETLVSLSACIDMGRWYFPNRAHESNGTHKEPAYRGVRQPVLDWVVYAYDICEGAKEFQNSRKKLVSCQRQFVSAIQETLDPRSREDEIRRVLNDFAQVSVLPKVQSPDDR